MSIANLKQHINLYFNPVILLLSTFDNLTWPPPSLLPFSPLVEPANTLVSLHLQLMKATVLVETFVYFHLFDWVISTTVMSTDVSQVGVALFPSI